MCILGIDVSTSISLVPQVGINASNIGIVSGAAKGST